MTQYRPNARVDAPAADSGPPATARPATAPPHRAEPVMSDVRAEDFEAFHRAGQRGFQEEVPDEQIERDRALFVPGRFYGYRVADRWISTFGALTRRLTVPGGATVPVAAVTDVTVHGAYRGRGLLRGMMTRQIAEARERGEVLAGLYASESGIYGRFGFGSAAPRTRLSGRTDRLAFRPDIAARLTAAGGSVDEVTGEQYLAMVRDVHDELRSTRPGSLDRPEQWWRRRLSDLAHERDGASALRHVVSYDDAGRVDGHATYRVMGSDMMAGPDNQTRVGEVEAATPAGYARLWRYLLDLALSRRFSRVNAPIDDPLRSLVADSRAIATTVLDGLYLRLLDVPTALRARRYAAPLDLVIEVGDAMVGDNAGRYRVRTADRDDAGFAVAVDRVDDEPDLTLDVRDLGEIYLGGPSLAVLHRAGVITEHRPGAVLAAATAFAWPIAPFCADPF